MRPQDIERIAAGVAGSFTGSTGRIAGGCGALSSPIAYTCEGNFSCADDYECGEEAVFDCSDVFNCDLGFFCGCGQFEGTVED